MSEHRATQQRQGTTVEHSTSIGLEAEISVDTDKNTAVVHDGSTEGGHPLVTESDFEAHTDDTDIHYLMTDIEIEMDQISNLWEFATSQQAINGTSTNTLMSPALTKEHLDERLFQNDGTIVEVDQDATISAVYTFSAGSHAIKLENTGASSIAFQDNNATTDERYIEIRTFEDTVSSQGQLRLGGRLDDGGTATTDYLYFRHDGSIKHGSVDYIDNAANFQELYDNSNRVYSASNAPAFSDVSGDIGNSQVPESAVTQHEGSLSLSASQVSEISNLTTSEGVQLENIGSNTISNTQWGYLGGLGSAPLESDDLAANGGELLQASVDETISGLWRIQRSGSVFLEIQREQVRTWEVRINSQGRLQIYNPGESTSIINFDPDNGVFLGSVSGLSMGAETFNGTLYDNSNRVYSASNAPASTDLSDHETATVELGGDFDAGEEVLCERIGNWVTITSVGDLSHTSSSNPTSAISIPSQFRPSAPIAFLSTNSEGLGGAHNKLMAIDVSSDGSLDIHHMTFGGTDQTPSLATDFSVTYLIT